MAVGLREISLPIFLTKENKYTYGWLVAVLATVLYVASNRIHFFPPMYLSMSWIDQTIPFVPETVWIYVSEYLLFGLVYLLSRDLVNTNKYLYSFFGLQLVSILIFWFFPTTFPRELYPLSDDLHPWTHSLFSAVRAADTPANCAPSLHVSSCYLSSFIFLDEQKKKFPFFFLWATAVGVTTLTTKQHYIIDVALGFLLAVAMYWIFHRYVRYRKPGSQPN